MKLNANTAVSTEKLLLVPYEARHVLAYHDWMKDPDLQAATASEALTLDEEYDMQRSWRSDHDKLTFIICHPIGPERDAGVRPGTDDGDDRMIGDINLFLFPQDEVDHVDVQSDQNAGRSALVGEVELMIARKDLQRQGFGRAAVLAFIWYVLECWTAIAMEFGSGLGHPHACDGPTSLAYLRVRINESNERSSRLFESIGFERTAEGANYFGEIELRWRPQRQLLDRQKAWLLPTILSYHGG